MKTINVARIFIIAILVGVISVFSSYAASPAAAVSAKNIRQKFITAVATPDDRIETPSSGEVEILFTVTDEGSIDIKKMDASSDEIANFIKEKIAKIPCSDVAHPYNQYYKVKFLFQMD